jgi:hypothetical protein
MKITQNQLRKIIQEELRRISEEDLSSDELGGSPEEENLSLEKKITRKLNELLSSDSTDSFSIKTNSGVKSFEVAIHNSGPHVCGYGSKMKFNVNLVGESDPVSKLRTAIDSTGFTSRVEKIVPIDIFNSEKINPPNALTEISKGSDYRGSSFQAGVWNGDKGFHLSYDYDKSSIHLTPIFKIEAFAKLIAQMYEKDPETVDIKNRAILGIP